MVENLNNTSTLRAEYLAHIQKQRGSGLSIRKYCEQNNLMDHKFSYYKGYKLRANKTEAKKLKPFAKVEIKTKINHNSEALPNTRIDRVDIDPVWLAKFIDNLVRLK